PESKTYEHAKTWNDDNGHSHVRASAVGFSESVPVVGGHPVLGTWQQVVVIDFDTGPRRRTFTLTGIY
ncbi:MAG: YjbQ family protein, partial [Elusimicrobiota bacterium]|nr:YjbQ family protein [Elusimicrobiota bacterium]